MKRLVRPIVDPPEEVIEIQEVPANAGLVVRMEVPLPRKDLVLAVHIVIDTSASMKAEAVTGSDSVRLSQLNVVQHAVNAMVQCWPPTSFVKVSRFSDQMQEVVPWTQLTNKDTVVRGVTLGFRGGQIRLRASRGAAFLFPLFAPRPLFISFDFSSCPVALIQDK